MGLGTEGAIVIQYALSTIGLLALIPLRSTLVLVMQNYQGTPVETAQGRRTAVQCIIKKDFEGFFSFFLSFDTLWLGHSYASIP